MIDPCWIFYTWYLLDQDQGRPDLDSYGLPAIGIHVISYHGGGVAGPGSAFYKNPKKYLQRGACVRFTICHRTTYFARVVAIQIRTQRGPPPSFSSEQTRVCGFLEFTKVHCAVVLFCEIIYAIRRHTRPDPITKRIYNKSCCGWIYSTLLCRKTKKFQKKNLPAARHLQEARGSYKRL